MSEMAERDANVVVAALADRRRMLRASIDRAKARMRHLPAAEQKRLYERSRAESPTLFAMLYRLQEDPLTDQLVRAAVERTRQAPTVAELTRAIARTFNSAFRAGQLSFREAAHFVLCRLCEEFGETNAARIKLSDLQRGYLAVSARSRGTGFDGAVVVMAVPAISAVRQFEQQAIADATPRPSAATMMPASDPVQREPLDGSAGCGEEQLLATGLVAACLHIEAGVRNFSDFAEAMAADLGEAVRPYLRVFYEAIRHYPGIDLTSMRPATELDGGLKFAQ